MTEPYAAPADSDAPDEALVTAPSYVQLTQQRVRLRRAAEVFASPDDAGRYPIVVLVKQGGRFQVEVLLVAVAVAAAALLLPLGPILTVAGLVAAVALFFAGSARAVLTPVPEGTQAVLAQRGRFLRVVGPGIQRVPPTVVVTHLVTTREIPFGALVRAAPTADDVRVDIEILFTFQIEDPGKFVYNTTAPDFDAVCLGSAQATVREIARSVKSDARPRHGRPRVRADPGGADVGPGALRRAGHRRARRAGRPAARLPGDPRGPPPGHDPRRRSRRSRPASTGACSRTATRSPARRRRRASSAPRSRPSWRPPSGAARSSWTRDTEALRLEKLQERLARFPEAARWDWAGERLKVARELAGNSRAMLQHRRHRRRRRRPRRRAPSSSRAAPEPPTAPRAGGDPAQADAARRAARAGRLRLERDREGEDDEDRRGHHLDDPDLDRAERARPCPARRRSTSGRAIARPVRPAK